MNCVDTEKGGKIMDMPHRIFSRSRKRKGGDGSRISGNETGELWRKIGVLALIIAMNQGLLSYRMKLDTGKREFQWLLIAHSLYLLMPTAGIDLSRSESERAA